MENKKRAVLEVLGLNLQMETADKYFYNVNEYLLNNMPEIYLETLDLRMGMDGASKSMVEYHVFRFMMQQLLKKNPHKLLALCPLPLESDSMKAVNLEDAAAKMAA